MKNILFFTTLIVLMCCSNDKSKPQENVIDATMHLAVMDSEGNDLLNPITTNAIDIFKIKVFYMVDGIKQEANIYDSGNENDPKNIIIIPPSDSGQQIYIMGLFLNTDDKSNITTTLLQWDKNKTDTFKAELDRYNNSVVCTKVWLNDEVVFDVATSEGLRFYEIVM